MVRFIAGLMLLLPASLQALPGSTWLEIGPGGRAAALGEAMTASVVGAGASYWNPAAMDPRVSTLEIMHNSWWVSGGSSQFVAGTFPTAKKLILGVSALHVGVGDLELRNRPDALPVGTFDARNFALGASAAYTFTPSMSFGATFRYLSEEIYIDHANGWSLDLGWIKRGLMAGALDLGATVRHLGEMEPLRVQSHELPTTYAFGGLYRLKTTGTLTCSLMAEAVKVREHDTSLRGGVEVSLYEYLALRGGYLTGIEGRGLTAGFGLAWERWQFDYGYTPFRDDLGHAQRISLGVRW